MQHEIWKEQEEKLRDDLSRNQENQGDGGKERDPLEGK